MNPLTTIATYSEGWNLPLGIGFFNEGIYKVFLREEGTQDIVWEFLSLLSEFQGPTRKTPEWTIYSHSSQGVANKFIMESLLKHGEPIEPYPGLNMVKWLGKRITFVDTYKLLPMSLKSLCKAFNIQNQLDYDLREGPYSFKAYLEKDCLDLEGILQAFIGRLEEKWEITPSLTLANTSMKIFSKKYFPTSKIYSNEEWDAEIRAATYGGRNEIYKNYGENINIYDVSSMFMSCYDTPVPTGRLFSTKPNIDTGTLAEAKVKVPTDLEVGPLPFNLEGNLIFPVGEFQGLWDVTDLRNAVRPEWGCDVTILKQLRASEEPILGKFGEDFLELRYTEKSLDKIWKQMGVILYGKFGEKQYPTNVKHETQIPWDEMANCVPFEGTDESYFLVRSNRKSPYKKPAIAMRIRAEARVRHSNLLLEASKLGDLFYCDTDSVFTTAQLPTPNQPGMLHLVYPHPAWRGYFIRQKFYALIFPGGRTLSRTAGYSGQKLREEDFQKMLEGQDVPLSEYRDTSMRQVLAYQPLERRKLETSVRLKPSPGREIVGTKTRPIQLPLTQEVAEELIKELEISHAP